MFNERNPVWIRIYKAIAVAIFVIALVGGIGFAVVNYLSLDIGIELEKIEIIDGAAIDLAILVVGGILGAFVWLMVNMIIIQFLNNVNVIRASIESNVNPNANRKAPGKNSNSKDADIAATLENIDRNVEVIKENSDKLAVSGVTGGGQQQRATGILTKYTGNGGDVVIPNNATGIGDSAFAGNSSVTSITIPSSVRTIGTQAFLGCDGLKSITFEGKGTWYETSSSDFTGGEVIDVSNPAINARTLRSGNDYLYRK